jgi:arylsulfatase A-like enzyme
MNVKLKRLAVLACCILPALLEAAPRPNVVFIMADDLGVGDVGFYHRQRTGKEPVIPTPNLDKLYEQGIRFDHVHAEGLCAPTRYTVMTGNYTFRCHLPWGVWGSAEKPAVQPGQKTIGNVMQEAGYKTAFFGKWHLGGQWYRQGTDKIYDGPAFGKEADQIDAARGIAGGGPSYLGFDYSLTLPGGIQGPPFAFFENSKWMKLGEDSEMKPLNWNEQPKGSKLGSKGAGAKLGDSNYDSRLAGPMLTQKAIDFIDREKDNPFFIYFCSQAVHHPHSPPDEFMGDPVKGQTHSEHGDMIIEFDLQVAALVKKLKEEGLWENTLFIVTSDNGGLALEETDLHGHLSSNGLRQEKSSAYEGGHRVPFVATWPGKIKPGTFCDKRTLVLDLMATLYDLTDREIPQDQACDSFSYLQLLQGKADALFRDQAIITNGRLYEGKQMGAKKMEDAICVFDGDWKLVAKWDKQSKAHKKWAFMNGTVSPVALFDLGDNPFEDETKNLLMNPEHKPRVERMIQDFYNARDTEGSGRTTPTEY